MELKKLLTCIQFCFICTQPIILQQMLAMCFYNLEQILFCRHNISTIITHKIITSNVLISSMFDILI
jgi:hypothetical protein